MTGMVSADETLPRASETMSAEAPLKIVLSEWRADIPTDVTWVRIGGGIGRSDFPALSIDRSRITLLHEVGTLESGYPIFEVWSTRPPKLLRRIPLLPRADSDAWHDVNMLAPEVVAAVKGQLVEVNRILVQGGYRSMESFFDFSDWKTVVAEKWGMRVAVEPMKVPSDGDIFRVSTLQGERDLLVLKLPRVIRPMGDDPMSSCGNAPYPSQGWYDPTLRISVIRLINPGGSPDGCDLPEEWILKGL